MTKPSDSKHTDEASNRLEAKSLDQWLNDVVVPAHDALRANPKRGLSATETRSLLGLDDETTDPN